MKNFTIATVAILLFCISLFAQAPDTLWTKTYGGGAADLGNFVQQTADLGYIIAGSTESFGAGSTDIYLIKTNYLGDTLWTKTYGGANADIAYCVQQTTDLGYIIVGQTASYGAGGNDVYLIKTNGSGNVIWTKTYGGGGNDRGASVKQTTDGGYIISGTTDSFGGPYDNVYIIKTNASGDTLWTRTWNSPGDNDDRGAEVQQTSDGGYIVTGHSWFWVSLVLDVILIKTNSAGVISWVKNYGIREEQRGNSVQETYDNGYIIAAYTSFLGNVNPDFYLIKTNNLGDPIWTKTFGGPYEESPSYIRQTADSGYVVAGHTNSFGAGSYDAWLLKTDQLGNEMWNNTLGGIGDDRGVSVQQTVDEGFIIAGRTNSFGAGNYDVWLIKLTPNLLIAFNEPFNNLTCWTAIGPLGTTNWSISTSTNAGGSPPSELILTYYPVFNGLSKFLSCTINSSTLYINTVTLKHFCDWWADPAPFMGIGVSYDAGTTYNTLWQFQPVGGNVGPEDILVSFTPTQNNYQLVLFHDGNSDFIDYWYVDDVMVYYIVPVELTSFTASVNNNNVTLNWTTATELNNQGFEIERASLSATPSQVWEKIGFVPGAGTTTEPRSYSFVDNDITPGKYSYRLKQIDYDGTFKYSEEVEVEIELQAPVEYALEQNYPNPFNPVTIIKYNLPAKNLVTLKVYNLLGEVVTTLVNEIKEAGSYQVEFDAGSLSSGIYFYTIKAGEYAATKKMVLLK